jgi:glycosyltransferase involved in cell wall biosynthesis
LYVNNVRPIYVLNPLVNLAQAIAVARQHRFDLIHTHGYRADVFGLAVAKYFGLPLVSTVHGFIGIDSRLRFYNSLDLRVLRLFTRVISVSDRMKEDLVHHGLSPQRVEVVTNAVPAAPSHERETQRRDARERLGIREDEFVFGYVGRLSEEKGVDYLLEAARRLLAERDGFRVVVVGDGPRREELERAAADSGLGERIIFGGFQADTRPWYAAMDAFVLPSLTEGTPMALLEAMACGLPVIASRVGGVPAVITDGRNGLLVAPADAAALCDAMAAVVGDPSLRQTLSRQALESIERHYGMKEWIRKTVAVYHAAVASRSGVPLRRNQEERA